VSDIFISYSSRHRELTAALAAAIEAQYGPGSVWWDRALESRAGFEPQIKAALEKARVVVVIWTAGAIESDYVYSEASDAQRDGKLVNVRPADVPFREIPKPFDVYQIDDLAETDRILATIAKVWRGQPIPTRVPLAEIYYRQHGKRVLQDKQNQLPADLASMKPSDLLHASYGLVPYDDATGMRAGLIEWCRGGSSSAAGRLIHGPGGLGKTRLMIEVASSLREEHGWQAGFLDRPPEDAAVARQREQALEQMIAHGPGQGLLIVMDYAEPRQKELKELAERLQQRAPGEARAVRLVLLTRSAGEWWTRLLEESQPLARLFFERRGMPAAIEMPRMVSGEDRLHYFVACAGALAPAMAVQGYRPSTPEPSVPRLERIRTGERYTRPLAIQMEAMLWLAASAPDDAEQGVDKLLARVLGLERAHWDSFVGALDQDGRRAMGRGVAQVTAVQGVGDQRSGYRLLQADRFYGGKRQAPADVAPLHDRLASVYGRGTGGLVQLEPDLIGEHHVATTADIEMLDGCIAWIDSEPEEVRGKRRQDLITVLQRATQEEHGAAAIARATALLDHLITAHGDTLGADMVAVMGETPGALFGRLAAQVEALSEPALAAINFALPIQHVAWMEFSLRVAERYADLARNWKTAADAAGLPGEERDRLLDRAASGFGTLGIRLSNLGRREQALAASQEAVDIYRALAKDRPDAFLPDLASSLNNLGIRLSNLGRREQALAASQEAVDIRRALAKDRPDAFLPDLASSLNNTGAMLSNLGRREQALAASQEAVDIRRALAKDRPDAFLPDLAMSLGAMSQTLVGAGRNREAAEAAREGMAAIVPFVEAQPRAFGDLAGALGRSHIEACESAGIEADAALLERIAAALQEASA
jgi:tetratricopeptide (TPR) repeat protein